MNMDEFIARNPACTEPDAADLQQNRSAAEQIIDQQQRMELAARKMQTISGQIERGTPPQYILFEAIAAIGLLTNDTDWATENADRLSAIYSDLAQQTLLEDTTATAQQRLRECQEAAAKKTLAEIARQKKRFQGIIAELNTLEKQVTSAEAPSGFTPLEDSDNPFTGTI